MATKLDPRLVKRVFELEKEAGENRLKWTAISEKINKEFGTNYDRETAANIHRRYKRGATAPDKFIPHEEPANGAGEFLERVSEIARTSKKSHKNPPTDVWRKWFTEAQGIRESVSDRELQATATIDAKKPIAVSFLGDWHIGSPHTDYDKLYGDIEFIKANPRLYCCISGDRTDQFMPGFKDASAVTGQLTPPELQLDAMEAILKELSDSIVAAIGGNHDRMAAKKTGIDTERWVRRGMKFSYLPHGGLLTLTVGRESYKILWKHHYRFNSSLNQFNSHHRMLEILEPTADLVVTEHEHNPGMESVERGTGAAKRTVISIRAGAYKVNDGYSMDYFKEGRPAPQTVILYPDRHKIVGFHGYDSMQDAATYLKAV